MITALTIQIAVANEFGLNIHDMTSFARQRHVARPRQIAMYLCRLLTPRSYPEIGHQFGKRDHATVMHAVKRVRFLIEEDIELADTVAILERRLRAMSAVDDEERIRRRLAAAVG